MIRELYQQVDVDLLLYLCIISMHLFFNYISYYSDNITYNFICCELSNSVSVIIFDL